MSVIMNQPLPHAALRPAAPTLREMTLVHNEDPAQTYARTYTSLVRLAYLLVDTQEHAEEVVQDAFVKVLPRWRSLQCPEAYLRRCVVNACRTAQRRRILARRTRTPLDAATWVEGDHVMDVIRRLSSPQRELIVMRFYLQATDAEMAAALRLPIGTVKSTLNRAKARLRKELQ